MLEFSGPVGGEHWYAVTPAEGQGSHQLGALSGATGLMVVPEDVEILTAGSRVEVMRLP
jgi:molybdopterin molybdotransferase